jgi:hypothetical protein
MTGTPTQKQLETVGTLKHTWRHVYTDIDGDDMIVRCQQLRQDPFETFIIAPDGQVRDRCNEPAFTEPEANACVQALREFEIKLGQDVADARRHDPENVSFYQLRYDVAMDALRKLGEERRLGEDWAVDVVLRGRVA